jgi:hypothetical protein
MSHRQTRLERISEGSFPYWVCLPEEKCIGANYNKHWSFCQASGLTPSRHGRSVVWQREWYCVFRFAEQEHADLFMQEFGGEPMHPSERGRGKHWSQWKKGTYRPIGCHLRRIDQDVSRQNVVDEGRWCLCCRQVERLGTDDPVPIAADIIT